MAIDITFRSGIFTSTNTTSYAASPTFTPAANSLLVAFVLGTQSSGISAPDSVIGHGVSYTLVAAGDPISTSHGMSVWVADAGASPSDAACTATWLTNRNGGVVMEYEITGANLSGGAAAAILQHKTQTGSSDSVTATNLLDAAGHADNRAMSFWMHAANELTTPAGGNWTEGADGQYGTPSTGAESQFTPSTFDRSPGASWTTSTNYGVIAIEVKATVVGGATQPPRSMHQFRLRA